MGRNDATAWIANNGQGTSENDYLALFDVYIQSDTSLTTFDGQNSDWDWDNVQFNYWSSDYQTVSVNFNLSTGYTDLAWREFSTDSIQHTFFTLLDFEQVSGTAGNDIFTGDDNRNFFNLDIGGDDIVNGGGGQDAVSFESTNTASVTAILGGLNSGAILTKTAVGTSPTETYDILFDSIEGIHGTFGNDTITLVSSDTPSNGMYVFARAGNDTITSYGDAFIVPGSGNDSITGSSSLTTEVSYEGLEDDNWAATIATPTKGIIVTATGANDYSVIDSWNNTDTLTNIGRIEGTEYSDTFSASSGRDYFVGGDDIDTAIFSGSINNYTINYVENVFFIKDKSSSSGFDVLDNFEILQFSDRTLSGTDLFNPTYVGPLNFGGITAITNSPLNDVNIVPEGYFDPYSGGDNQEAYFSLQKVDANNNYLLTGVTAPYINPIYEAGSSDFYKSNQNLYDKYVVAVNISPADLALISDLNSSSQIGSLFSHNSSTTVSSFSKTIFGIDSGTQFDFGTRTFATPADINLVFRFGPEVAFSGADTLTGGSGNNTIFGFAGNDVINGGAGDDWFSGGTGNNTLIGGDGVDAVFYVDPTFSATSGVTVNLQTGTRTGGGGTDVISGIEEIQGSQFNDTLIGNGGENFIQGYAGDDSIDGGAGIDFVGYWGNTGVVVDLENGRAFNAGTTTIGNNENLQNILTVDRNDISPLPEGTWDEVGLDTLSNIEGIIGSGFNDLLFGDKYDNRIEGRGGNDWIIGGEGQDTVSYRLLGLFDDVLTDTSESTSGYTPPMTPSMPSTSGQSGVYVNLDMNSATGANGYDKLDSIERVAGSQYNDYIYGSSAGTNGSSGNNIFFASGGHDSIYGNGGSDQLNFSEISTLQYGPLTTGITMTLGEYGTGSVSFSGNSINYNSIEEIAGSAFADTLTGNSSDNYLEGWLGNDVLDGGAGDLDNVGYYSARGAVVVNLTTGTATGADGTDTLKNFEGVTGSAFADTLTGNGGLNFFEGRGGNDTLDGGAGVDYAMYTRESSGVFVNLSANDVTSTGATWAAGSTGTKYLKQTATALGTGDTGTDTLISIEGVVGSSFSDTLIGSAGNDTLNGMGGADYIDGGAGDQDMASYSFATESVVVNLLTGTSSGADGIDQLRGIENIKGGFASDTLTGNAGNNVLDGGSGSDSLDGGAGNDTLIGGEGYDALVGGAGNDLLIVDSSMMGYGYSDSLSGGDGIDTLQISPGTSSYMPSAGTYPPPVYLNNSLARDIENLTYTGTDAVTLRGNDSVNVITGGSGNDFLFAYDGGDTLDGGAGFDYAVYAQEGSGYFINLSSTGVNYSGGTVASMTATRFIPEQGFTRVDTLKNIEGAIGTNYADTFIGGSGNDTFIGLNGDDYIDGGAGDQDTASYATSSNNVVVDLTTGTASGDGEDTLIRIENIKGGYANDTLTGNSGNNILDGGSGQDTLDGGAGNDILISDGQDVVIGGEGIDTLQLTTYVASPGTESFGGLFVLASDIENLTFTGTGKAVLVGNGLGNDIRGGTGNDSLFGDSGNDTIYGGAGNDWLGGEFGNNTIIGDEGNDFVVYADKDYSANSGIIVNLETGTRTGGGGTDKITGVEGVIASQFNDTLVGNVGDNYFEGWAGNDTIDGASGVDTVGYWVTTGVVVDLAQGRSFNAGTVLGNYGSDSITTINGQYQNTSLSISLPTWGDNVGTDKLSNIENIIGSGFADLLIGNQFDNRLEGRGGDDYIIGGDGQDTVSYRLLGLYGDVLSVNSVGMPYGQFGVAVDLSQNIAWGSAGNDQLESIERVMGSQYSDTLIGDSGSNIFFASGGMDTVDGDGGADQLNFSDISTFEYASTYGIYGMPSGVSMTLVESGSNGYVDFYGSNSASNSISYSNIEDIAGSAYADTLTGNSSDNYLEGWLGNDVLDGGAGDLDIAGYYSATSSVVVNLTTGIATGADGTDSLKNIEGVTGGAFADTLTGNGGLNLFEGRGGNDTLDGAAGVDYVVYANASGGVLVNLSGASVTLSGVTAASMTAKQLTTTGDTGTDTLISIEGALGSSFNDTFIGSAGDDTFSGLGGNDYIDGGAGTQDMASYFAATSGVTVNLLAGTSSGADGGDTLIGIENIKGSAFNDSLTGGAGNNTLDGGGGFDTLNGGDGNDLLISDGDDVVIGAAGIDTLQTSSSLVYSLASDIENLTFTGTGNFTATGNAADNVITGSKGNDILKGEAGNDFLVGGLGNDSFSGGSGLDMVSIAASSAYLDSSYFAGLNTSSNITIASSDGVDVVNSDVELIKFNDGKIIDLQASLTSGKAVFAVQGTDGPDTLNGTPGVDLIQANGGDDKIFGFESNDILDGGAGNDTIDGGTGADAMSGGTGNDVFLADNAGDVVTEEVNAGTDLVQAMVSNFSIAGFANVENLTFTGASGNATLTGNAGNNILTAGAGSDSLNGGAGADTLIGRAGNDVYVVDSLSDVVTETANEGTDLIQTTVSSYSIAGAGFANVENLSFVGTGNASLTGSAIVNALTGGSGNDTLDGGAGADTLTGGYGDDIYYVDNVSDVVVELFGDNTKDQEIFSMGNKNDVVVVAATVTNYVLTANANVEDMMAAGAYTGGVGTDTAINMTGNELAQGLIGNNANNVLKGEAGDDALVGWGGDDTLFGGVGLDFFVGGAGNDLMQGDAGSDAFLFNYKFSQGWDLLGRSFALVATGGNDTVDGGTEADFIFMSGSVSDYTITFTGQTVPYKIETNLGKGVNGAAESMVFSSIETLMFGDIDYFSAASSYNLLMGTANNDTLNASTGMDYIHGGAGVDSASYSTATAGVTVGLGVSTAGADYLVNIENIIGSAFNDTLTGDTGNNVLDGGAGNDTLVGGTGNDTYVVDSISDVVTENVNAGTDEIQTALSNFSIATGYANIENLSYTGTGNTTLTGNGGDNVIKGGVGGDTLIGGGGNDVFDGGAGTDLVIFGGVFDNYTLTVTGTGAAKALTVVAKAGSGFSGTSTFTAASGVESIRFVGSSDTVIEVGASLTNSVVVKSTTLTSGPDVNGGSAGIDVIYAGDGNDTIMGLASDDALYGQAGDDTLDGGTGADSLIGGDGNDLLLNVETTDVIIGGAGTDTVNLVSTVTNYTLASDVEVLSASTNTAGVTLRGNANNNLITGGSGSDTIFSGGSQAVRAATWGFTADAYPSGTKINVAGVEITLPAGSKGDDVAAQVMVALKAAPAFAGYTIDQLQNTLLVVAPVGQSVIGIFNQDNLGGLGTNIDMAVNAPSGNVAGVLNGENPFSARLTELNGAFNSDSLLGGLGNDTYVVESSTAQIFEGSSAGTDLVQTALSNFSIATLSNVENLTFTGATGNATLTGNDAVNVITGATGNDTLDGGAGADTLVGNGGNDVYVVDSLSDVVTESASAGTDTIQTTVSNYSIATNANVENLTFTGTGNATLTGNAAVNVITGGKGNDTIDGGTLADTLSGGDGNDVFLNVEITDVISGGSGTDTVNLQTIVAASPVKTYTLAADIEVLNASTSTADLTLTGNALDNVITGGTANDRLDGGAGNDTMVGGTGNDTYVIDSISDVVTENVNAGTDEIQTALSNFSIATGYANIENLSYTGTGNATLTGNGGVNVIKGGVGSDTLRGGGGNDVFDGGVGTDVVVFGGKLENYNLTVTGAGTPQSPRVLTVAAKTGTEAPPGGITGTSTFTVASGIEIISFDDSPQTLVNVLISLSSGQVRTASLGTSGPDIFPGTAGVDVVNALAGDDTISGQGDADALYGEAGNDTIDGGTGADSLFGGDGNDVFLNVEVADVISGGDGTDTVNLLNTVASYTLVNDVERLSASNNTTGVTLTGNAGENVITGGTGNDTLIGGAGADSLIGGAGNDVYVADTNSDVVIENANAGIDLVQTALSNFSIASYRDVENLTYTAATGGSFLTGNDGANTITGGAGNDTLDGGAGTDTLIGGAGNDTYLVNSTADKLVETNPTTVVGSGGTDTVVASVSYILAKTGLVENLTLSYSNATTSYTGMGNDLANTITGGIAGDRLYGGAGNDFLDGKDGNDTLRGGAGNDSLDGGAGNDYLLGGVGVDILRGADGDDTLSGGSGDATTAATGADTLYGGAGADTYLVNEKRTVVIEDDISILGTTGLWGLIKGDTPLDRILSSTDFDISTSNGIEELHLTGMAVRATGNSQTNLLIGNLADNLISAGGGDDALLGDASFIGDNDYFGHDRNALKRAEMFHGVGGDDSLDGGIGNDALVGQGGSDILDGGIGADIMIGGGGSDTYFVDNTADEVYESLLTGHELELAVFGSNGKAFHVADFASTYFVDTDNSATPWRVSQEQYQQLVAGGLNLQVFAEETLPQNLPTNAPYLLYDTVDGNAPYYYLSGNVPSGFTISAARLDAGGNDWIYQSVDLTKSNGDLLTLSEFSPFVENIKLSGTAISAVGSADSNMVLGSDIDNQIFGLAGDDWISAGAGIDFIDGGLGDDFIDGGAGFDAVWYSGMKDGFFDATVISGINANLTTNVVTGSMGIDRLSGVEGVGGTAWADVFVGDANANAFMGNAGNDTADGAAGVADMFVIGNSVANNKSASNLGVNLDFTQQKNFTTATTEATAITLNLTQFGLGVDKFWNIEGLGLTFANDTFTGSAFADTIWGMGGNDLLNGGAGNDVLFGGFAYESQYSDKNKGFLTDSGQDTFVGGLGDDTMDGGGDADVADYSETGKEAGGINVDFRGAVPAGAPAGVFAATVKANVLTAVGNTGSDTLINIEKVIGTKGDDLFTITDSRQIVIGGDGLDKVTATMQSFNLSSVVGSGIENLDTLFATGAVLGGNELNNSIKGAAGADTLAGLAGNDTLDGGAGLDTASFATATQTVVVDLRTGTASGEGFDTLVGIENVLGSNFNDRMSGTAEANTLDGGLGADLMAGGAGNDVYFVNSLLDQVMEIRGEGTDTVFLSSVVSGYVLASNTEVLDASRLTTLDYTSKKLSISNNVFDAMGGDQWNLMVGNSGSNTVTGGVGVDFLMGGGVGSVATGGADLLQGGKGGDIYLYDGAHVTIKENASEGLDLVLVQADSYILGENIEYAMAWGDDSYVSDANLTGNALDNFLVGSYGANTIDGGAGNDLIAGFGGDNLLRGGAGSDAFVWSQQGYEGVIADFSSVAKDKIALAFTPSDQGANGSNAMKYDLSLLTDVATKGGTEFTLNSISDASWAQVIYDPTSGLLQIDMPTWNVDQWVARDGLADAQMLVNSDASGSIPTLTAIDTDTDSSTMGDFKIMSDNQDYTHHPMT
jgi:trimeric autotransporter adhesin